MKYGKMLITAVIAIVGGLAFGASAMLFMSSPDSAGAVFGLGWLAVHIVSGTWFWAVLTTLVAWLLASRFRLKGWRRYIWTSLLALLFLIATTVAWYGVNSGLSILENLLTIVVINLPVAAGIGFVVAFASQRNWLGLVARLCLPTGLMVVLFVATPPSFLELASSNSATTLTVWWSQIAICIGLAVYFVIDWLARRKRIDDKGYAKIR